ncbi:MAG: hypothetical protein ABSH32_10905 [Bryobacteraceae bacterium]|jgi:hypothetical protein
MRVPRLYWLGLLLLIVQAPLPAQIGNPGGYPGQYPPNNGGLGIPVPRRHKKDKDKVELQTVSGMLRRIEKDQVVLEAEDTRILNFKRTDGTKFLKEGHDIKPAELRAGDHVEVEASEDDQGFLTAVNVSWQEDGTAAERRRAAEPVETSLAKPSADSDRPVLHRDDSTAEAPKNAQSSAPAAPASPAPQTASAPQGAQPAEAPHDDPNPADLNAPVKEQVPAVKIDADDEGPPVLKHGGKAVVHKQADAPPAAQTSRPELSARNQAPATDDSQPAAAAYHAPAPDTRRPEEVALEKAREAAGSFLETLPNYVCQEFMTRYQSSSNVVSWQPLDVVSMALVYEDRRESYRDVAVNGKLTKKNIEDLPGSWSTGEFGTVLADVFSPATAADFEYRRESRSGGRTAMLYDFSVEREHSHWRIMVASQLVTPSYKGSVWIDKETKRVLRIEMQATHMPEAFPADKVEMATDYEFVRFSELQFLVPVHAETLACDRGTDVCSRNAIDFRNYHKYSGESTIQFK